MKKNLTQITFLFFAILLPAVFAHGESVSRLEVQFESAPLFQNANFIPYDEVSRWIKVTNHTDVPQEVIVEAINYSSCPLFSFSTCLAKKLHLQITSGESMYFNKPLSELYGAGTVSLGNLPAGEMKQYDFRIVFESGDEDNDYQKSQTNFDLLVGFAGEGGGSVSTETGNGGGGGGGAGAGLPGLQIHNEAAVLVSGNTALVSWNTNYDSFGHVVYGIDTGAPYVFDLTLPNFGYPSSAPSDPSISGHTDSLPKTRNHLMSLSGLTPGATYRYRAVSHASPPTVGYEHTFTVPLESGGNSVNAESEGIGGSSEFPEEGDGEVLGAAKMNADEVSLGNGSSLEKGITNDSAAPLPSEKEGEDGSSKKNLAAAFGAFHNGSFSLWIFLFFAILFFFFFFLRKKKSES